MAYYLTGSAARRMAASNQLSPVKGGLERTAQERIVVQDGTGRGVAIPEGTKYRITGTRNGDGYVVTFDNDPFLGTRYFEASHGAKLV